MSQKIDWTLLSFQPVDCRPLLPISVFLGSFAPDFAPGFAPGSLAQRSWAFHPRIPYEPPLPLTVDPQCRFSSRPYERSSLISFQSWESVPPLEGLNPVQTGNSQKLRQLDQFL